MRNIDTATMTIMTTMKAPKKSSSAGDTINVNEGPDYVNQAFRSFFLRGTKKNTVRLHGVLKWWR